MLYAVELLNNLRGHSKTTFFACGTGFLRGNSALNWIYWDQNSLTLVKRFP